jgi:hypothetical protein
VLDYLVAYEPLRFLSFKYLAASFNADFCNAMNIVFKNAHNVLQRLIIRLILRGTHPLCYFIHQLRALTLKHLSRYLLHFCAVFCGSAAVSVICADVSGK